MSIPETVTMECIVVVLDLAKVVEIYPLTNHEHFAKATAFLRNRWLTPTNHVDCYLSKVSIPAYAFEG